MAARDGRVRLASGQPAGGHWRESAGSPRADSAASRLIAALPAYPVLSLPAACEVTGLSDGACRKALNALQAAGVLRETTSGRRNRVWESVGLSDILDRLERASGGQARAPAPTKGRVEKLPRARRRDTRLSAPPGHDQQRGVPDTSALARERR